MFNLNRFSLVGLVVGSALLAATPTYAQSSSERKAASRWTLDEWLRQKERNRLMDQWLALHSSDPYEFFLQLDSTSLALENELKTPSQLTKTVDQSFHGKIGAYASIVGLEAEFGKLRETDSEAFEGAFHLRLIGTSNQSTHLTIHYGLRFRQDGGETIRSQVPGATVSLYLLKHFGVVGSYHLELPTDSSQSSNQSSNQSSTWKGERITGEVFIDFGSVRVFGQYERQRNEVDRSAGGIDSQTILRREGLGGGLKFYF